MTTILLGRVSARLRFLPVPKNGLQNLLSAWTHSECLLWHTVKLTLDQSNVYRWYKKFSEVREEANDEERAGPPSTSTTSKNIDEVKKIELTYSNHR